MVQGQKHDRRPSKVVCKIVRSGEKGSQVSSISFGGGLLKDTRLERDGAGHRLVIHGEYEFDAFVEVLVTACNESSGEGTVDRAERDAEVLASQPAEETKPAPEVPVVAPEPEVIEAGEEVIEEPAQDEPTEDEIL